MVGVLCLAFIYADFVFWILGSKRLIGLGDLSGSHERCLAASGHMRELDLDGLLPKQVALLLGPHNIFLLR